MWLIMCLLRICSALYCKLSAGLSHQAVSSGVAGYSCLTDGPSPTPPLLRPLEVHLVRAASWHEFFCSSLIQIYYILLCEGSFASICFKIGKHITWNCINPFHLQKWANMIFFFTIIISSDTTTHILSFLIEDCLYGLSHPWFMFCVKAQPGLELCLT